MTETRNILYLAYEGITDHIGQSQVAPYLIGLAARGHQITLLSAEKMDRTAIIEKYKKIFAAAGIDWQLIPYHKKPAVLSSVYDVFRMQQRARSIIRSKKIDTIHARGYVTSLVALYFRKKGRVKYIFDMRDFWPDAGKEIKRFDVENNSIHRRVYNFFKKREKEFLEHADHIISLTETGKRIMKGWAEEGKMRIEAPITVIPCCADFSFFDRQRLDLEQVREKRAQLGIPADAFVLCYLGSLGPSYLTDEAMDVFRLLLQRKPDAYFLVVANNDHHLAKESAARKGVPEDRIIVTRGTKDEVPYLIAQANLSVFFIIPSFAKQACSPTKLAELLAMNVPVISNTRVGDLDSILDLDRNHSAVVRSFDDAEYNRVLDLVLPALEKGNEGIREASRGFALEFGVETYDRVYRSLGR